ncbi:MAG TPA: helix-turn-helix domain-containing protein [Acidimicrobiales bacterium]|jgi:DNA-binding HxlR family transcriptional regulator|nr:helix-turn-helix domain-containing protein [Acidimicrobiales bacterium]
MRSYGEFCALARALDVVGDRWTLLIVRELLIRACRYTDLRDGLPGIATNLLADRLRELEAEGIVQREEPEPPVATTLYRLTDRGEQLRPVVHQLLRWGAPLMLEPAGDDEFRSRWLVEPIEALLNRAGAETPDVVVQVDTGDEPLVIEASGGHVRARTGTAPEPDAILRGPPDAVLGVVMGFLEPGSRQGRKVTIDGDGDALARLRQGFGLA